MAAGSDVTKSVQSNTAIGGNPVQYICTVSEFVERNKKYNLGRKMTDSEKRRLLTILPDDEFIMK